MILALRAKALKQGTANASGNDGSNQNGTPTVNLIMEAPKRKYVIKPLNKVLRKAKRLYYSQVDKSVENKKKCIMNALASYDNLYPDKLRFELEFRAERDRLVDSKRFCEDCVALHLIPEDVADHVVFEGKGILEKVLKEGLMPAVGEKVHMFNLPLWEDSQGLYTAKDKKEETAGKPEVAEVEPAPKGDE